MKRTALALMVILALLFSIVAGAVEVSSASDDSWTAKQPMPTARSELGVAVVNGKIYAIGGSRGVIVGYDNNEEYDPAKDTWITKKSMPTPRGGFAIAVFQDKIYVIGGAIRAGTGFTEMTLVNEVYDPATDTWATKMPMPMLKYALSANVVNGKIYLIGGLSQSAPNSTVSPSTENLVYDPSTDSWTTKAVIPTAAYNYASAVIDNKIYVISGHETEVMSDNGTTHIPAPNQIYDPQTDTWSNRTSMPIAVDFGAAAGATTGVVAPKAIYVMGGFVGFVSPLNFTQVYHPENDTWSVGASMQTARWGLGVAVVDDMLYAIGGSPFLYQPDVAENAQYTPFEYGTVPPDTTPPAVSIVSPENKTYTASDVSLTFTVNEPTIWMAYSLDGQANVTVTGNTTLTGLSYDSHSLTGYANDTAGNMGSSETLYFTISHKTQPSEPFPTTLLVATVALLGTIGVGLLINLKKRKGTRSQ